MKYRVKIWWECRDDRDASKVDLEASSDAEAYSKATTLIEEWNLENHEKIRRREISSREWSTWKLLGVYRLVEKMVEVEELVPAPETERAHA